jgi:lysyl-tRNA synthetase class 2
MADWQPTASLEVLTHRAQLLDQTREFFAVRNVLEVETPLLGRHSVTDPNIESFEVMLSDEQYYLQTSPEYAMKRLLAAGAPDIYQICKSFRREERGAHHHPEFTLIEWYRKGFSMQEIMNETAALITLLVPSIKQTQLISYDQALQTVLNLSLAELDENKLSAIAAEQGLQGNQGLSRDQLLDFVFSQCVATTFDKQLLTLVYHYPASQAALAKITQDNPQTAERFEVFCGELELANGYVELTDPEEQLKRFKKDQTIRKQRRLTDIDIDPGLLAAQQHGLPECAGVAVGLDRLIMLATQSSHIKHVISFDS